VSRKMTSRRVGATVDRRPAARSSDGTASMLALQRSAGNTSTMALLRRASGLAQETPAVLTLSGLVNDAAVSSWNLARDMRGETSGLELTRPIDVDSPVLAKALFDGAPNAGGRLTVRKLTPLGWVRQLTVTMADCTVASYQVHDNYESVRLEFSRVQVEQ